MTIIYRYNEKSNPGGFHLDNVPLRDLEEGEVEDMPLWLILSIENCSFYSVASKAKALSIKKEKAPEDEPVTKVTEEVSDNE